MSINDFQDRDSYRPYAQAMVDSQLRGRGISDPAVLGAMQEIPRHRFLPGVEMAAAYADSAQPTAEGQTISQPYMVALMTQELQVSPGLRVLEIGTGSGYQTAILAHLGAAVVSVETSQRLADQAQRTLGDLGYHPNVTIVVGDGTLGYAALAPYHRILVTAGAPKLPAAFRNQLVDGGRIVIPIGDRVDQQLTIFDRRGDQWLRHDSIGCRFVPLIGADAWPEADLHRPH